MTTAQTNRQQLIAYMGGSLVASVLIHACAAIDYLCLKLGGEGV